MATREPSRITSRFLFTIFLVFMLVGVVTFIVQTTGNHPEKAWQTYLINFLMFSAMAQGGLLFSVVMNTVNARWSGSLDTV
ncbi:MAG TPA: hypothetical protein VLP30_02150, partial [Desulfatirhabdiaceae bacterium]|nr:hypothetical protein [Desulfatirhabdiaceae bacterium]